MVAGPLQPGAAAPRVASRRRRRLGAGGGHLFAAPRDRPVRDRAAARLARAPNSHRCARAALLPAAY
eukprot:scaffold34270_cov63-Phaeocystis_antarctica.AAC.2